MPTVRRSGPYRIYFFSNEGDEPPHVHVDRDERSAKLWLRPVRLAHNYGFDRREIKRLYQLIQRCELECWEAWHDYFA